MNEGIYPLNTFGASLPGKDTISAISVVFKKDSKLSKCADIKFYSDPFGITEIDNINASKNKNLKDVPPFLFN